MQKPEDKYRTEFSGVRASTAVGVVALSVPLLLYAVAAAYTSFNIPFQDDFDSIGDFLLHYVSLHGFVARFWWVLTAQHVQYKLILMNAVVAAQYALIGHTNYRTLQLIGDLAIPLSVLVLWFVFARSRRPLQERVWLFLPACWIFCAMRYAQTINWTMSALVNLVVIPLGLAAILFATSTRRHSSLWTQLFVALSIAASGNGFVVAIVVSYLLLRGRRYRALIAELAVVFAFACLYAVHYQVYQVYPPIPLRAALKSVALYPFAFLGNAANSPAQAVVLGAVLVLIFLFLAFRGWYRVCPGSFGAALFCLVTSVVVTAGRYRSGYAGALAGHYAMYSLLLLAVEYMAIVRLFAPVSLALRSRWAAGLAITAMVSILFCLWADGGGYREIHARQRDAIAHLILWERHPDHLVLVPDEESYERTPAWILIRENFQRDMQRQITEGLYRPPYSASDSLPVRPHSPATIGIEDEPWPPR